MPEPTKICWQCRAEVPLAASVCMHCKAALSGAAPGKVASKPTSSTAVGCLVLLGLFGVLSVMGWMIKPDTPPPAAAPAPPPPDPKYGKRPDPGALRIAIRDQLRQGLHDPSSLDDLNVSDPVKDSITLKGRKVDCWRVNISFRAKNGFGALRLNRMTMWIRDDLTLKTTGP